MIRVIFALKRNISIVFCTFVNETGFCYRKKKVNGLEPL